MTPGMPCDMYVAYTASKRGAYFLILENKNETTAERHLHGKELTIQNIRFLRRVCDLSCHVWSFFDDCPVSNINNSKKTITRLKQWHISPLQTILAATVLHIFQHPFNFSKQIKRLSILTHIIPTCHPHRILQF